MDKEKITHNAYGDDGSKVIFEIEVEKFVAKDSDKVRYNTTVEFQVIKSFIEDEKEKAIQKVKNYLDNFVKL